MEGTKFIKAYCDKAKQYFALEIKQFGSIWKVVNVTHLSNDEAKVVSSEIRQPSFETNDKLLPCRKCGSRKVGGCSCSKTKHQCKVGMKYQFDCVYCDELKIDYSLPTLAEIGKKVGGKVVLSQGQEVKIVTFSNVKWTKFDNIQYHESGAEFHEPKIHVAAMNEDIEFHGYNISEMDEGVYYVIDASDDFEIECDVDTSNIKPHPGGHLYISFGSITAEISETGGYFKLNDQAVANVGSRFHMILSLVANVYSIIINNENVGTAPKKDNSNVMIKFGFAHDSHYCELLSHAYIRGIKMRHRISKNDLQ